MMGGSSGGGGGDQRTEVRYAPYVENNHQKFLNAVAAFRESLTGDSPFGSYDPMIIDLAFFGTGYNIVSYPTLWDMFGKFGAGLDIDTLRSQIFQNTVNGPEVNNLVLAESDLLDDDVQARSLPRLKLGARNINAVLGTNFRVEKALVESARVKSLAKFSAELKYRLIPVASDNWKTHLTWNKDVVRLYAELIKLYYSARMDGDEHNYSMAAKHKLWPFTVLEYERAALGALQGARTTSGQVAGSSTAGKAIGGALGGAAAASMMGASMTGAGLAGPWGLALGAGIGLASTFL